MQDIDQSLTFDSIPTTRPRYRTGDARVESPGPSSTSRMADSPGRPHEKENVPPTRPRSPTKPMDIPGGGTNPLFPGPSSPWPKNTVPTDIEEQRKLTIGGPRSWIEATQRHLDHPDLFPPHPRAHPYRLNPRPKLDPVVPPAGIVMRGGFENLTIQTVPTPIPATQEAFVSRSIICCACMASSTLMVFHVAGTVFPSLHSQPDLYSEASLPFQSRPPSLNLRVHRKAHLDALESRGRTPAFCKSYADATPEAMLTMMAVRLLLLPLLFI